MAFHAAAEKTKEGEWQIVTQWKNKTSPITTTQTTKNPKAYQSYFTKPSYADIVRTNPPKYAHPQPNLISQPTFHNKPPQRPKGDYYVSPHCVAQLRFPPSSRYVEWKGRCFRCCQMGHSASRCKNPKRCGRCWGQGHIGSFCKVADQIQLRVDTPTRFKEPKFEELLQGNLPPIDLPTDRPQKIICFIERDEQYYEELGKLDNAVVMYNPSLEVDLSIEQVAEYAASSGLVKASDISVGVMTRSRYVILLPICIDPAKFIRGIPSRVWEEGFSFSLWCPLDDAKVVIPRYKVMLDLVGIPLDLYKEQNVIRAISSIGTYLGTVAQVMEGDVACWTVVVATSSLSLIPHQVAYIIGGLEKLVDVVPKACVQGEVYKPCDLPQPKEVFNPPIVRPSSSSSSSLLNSSDVSPNGSVDDQFIGSRKVLEKLCQGIDFQALPTRVQAVLRGASSMEETGVQQNVVTDDPVIAKQRVDATENPGAAIKVSQLHAKDPGANLNADLIPILGAVTCVEVLVSSPIIVGTNSVENRVVVQKWPQNISAVENF
ncbi:hypothetical protein FCM35_KLT07509 [Carex littledalei]|uniref:CCHC-type domain-containing protein n=1 Tax=Carex littledalei TaxID=544730 RepID=A0A833QSQ2_9POAL|nr:hypothetical protein FCM35_KLT07509 [Carex littledalei]